MKILIKNARLIEDEKGQPTDVFIENGVIQRIANSLTINELDQKIEAEGAFVSPGFLDIGPELCDPGHERRETLQTAARAARAGGFTALAPLAATDPCIDSGAEITYLKSRAKGLGVRIFPLGALSVERKGADMAELFDMKKAGAVAFSDGPRSTQDVGLLLRVLEYSKAFGGLIFNQPHDKSLASGGQMHEGVLSTQLGMRGISALSEEIVVQRDLSLLEYSAGGRLHFQCISTEKSVEMIRKAKKSGLAVSASVAALNLGFTDSELSDFESNWKVLPPLRGENDRVALWAGLLDGTIDFVCSNHRPHDEEGKNLEFPYAEFGAIGLETAFSTALTFRPKSLKINELARFFYLHPRKILGIEVPKIAVGERAELTVFAPDEKWVFSEKDIHSKSANTPLVGEKLKGKVLGIVNRMNKSRLV